MRSTTSLSDTILSTTRSVAQQYVQGACRFAVDEFLARGIVLGSLTFSHAQQSDTVFGETVESAKAANRPIARIHVCNSAAFYTRVATSADIGFAEAFMAGDMDASPDDLLGVFHVLILNRDGGNLKSCIAGFGPGLSCFGRWINWLVHQLNKNTLAGSARNIAAHYDQSNELFGTFLGETWTYSCGFFDDKLALGERTLDRAQRDKLDMIIDKARITKDCHVLEIGCGWAELAIRMTQRTGCRVTGITLSREQLCLGRKRVEAAGVADRVELELMDYRELVRRGGQTFSRVVSVEMVEAVGHEFLGGYFEAIGHVLKQDGVVVLQGITMPDARYEEYRGSSDFIQKHIFPGGMCPSAQAVMSAAASCGLDVEHVQNMGPHYATTLACWRARFCEAHGDSDLEFWRKWVYYFCYCQAGFETRTLNVLQLVLSRGGNVGTLGGAPASSSTGCGRGAGGCARS